MAESVRFLGVFFALYVHGEARGLSKVKAKASRARRPAKGGKKGARGPKTPASRAKTIVKRSRKAPKAAPRVRLPKGATETLRKLARKGESVAEAAVVIGVTADQLTGLLRDRPKVAQAWERGRLVYNVEQLARTGSSYEEAETYLKMAAGEFEVLVTRDPELHDTWRQARVAAAQAVAVTMYKNAQEGGVQAAKSMLERLSRDAGGAREVNFLALSVNDTSKAFGMSRQTLHAWKTKGAPCNADGSFHLPALVRWRINQVMLDAGPAAGGESETAGGYRKMKTRLLEVQYNKELGELLDRRSVIAGLVNRVRHQTSVMDADTKALAAAMEGKSVQQVAGILTKRFAAYRKAMADVPDELQLPPDAKERLARLLRDLTTTERGGSTDGE